MTTQRSRFQMKPLRTGRGHVASFGVGRVCEVSECDTVLSRYNDTGVCWSHDDTKPKRAAS